MDEKKKNRNKNNSRFCHLLLSYTAYQCLRCPLMLQLAFPRLWKIVYFSLALPDASMCETIGGRTEGEGRKDAGSGNSGQVSVGSARILAESIRLKLLSLHAKIPIHIASIQNCQACSIKTTSRKLSPERLSV